MAKHSPSLIGKGNFLDSCSILIQLIDNPLFSKIVKYPYMQLLTKATIL